MVEGGKRTWGGGKGDVEKGCGEEREDVGWVKKENVKRGARVCKERGTSYLHCVLGHMFCETLYECTRTVTGTQIVLHTCL